MSGDIIGKPDVVGMGNQLGKPIPLQALVNIQSKALVITLLLQDTVDISQTLQTNEEWILSCFVQSN